MGTPEVVKQAPSNAAQTAGKAAGRARASKQKTVSSPSLANFGKKEREKVETAPQSTHRPHTGGRRRKVAGGKPAGSIETRRKDRILPGTGSGHTNTRINIDDLGAIAHVLHGEALPTTKESKPDHRRGLRPPWKPGESGNIKGRPPGGSSDAKALAREFGEEINPKTGRTRDEHLLGLLYRRACQGNMKAAELWAGYRWGKPTQAVELDARLDFTDRLTRIRERARQLPEPTPALPAPAPTNGHAGGEQAATVHEFARSLVGIEEMKPEQESMESGPQAYKVRVEKA